MATTTNYGWTTPDDTALVKDGASAIRTLGTSVDTTTKNLNPETTLGDISFRSSTSNVNTRLGIGGTGTVLTVAAGVPSWATPAAGGGQTLISTNTLSSTSTSISIPSGYKDVIIRAVNMQISNSSQYRLTFNSNTGSVYGLVGLGRQNTSVFTTGGSQTTMDSEGTISSATNIQIQLYVSDYLATTHRQYTLQSSYTVSSGGANDFRSYAFLNTTAITTVQISSVGGTGTLSGTCYIIGVN